MMLTILNIYSLSHTVYLFFESLNLLFLYRLIVLVYFPWYNILLYSRAQVFVFLARTSCFFSSEGLFCLNRELLSFFMEDLRTDSMEQSINGR